MGFSIIYSGATTGDEFTGTEELVLKEVALNGIPQFDETGASSYVLGEQRVRMGRLYVANKATSGAFNAADWDEVGTVSGLESVITADPVLTANNTINAGTNQLIVEGSVATNRVTLLEGSTIGNEFVRTKVSTTAGTTISPTLTTNQNLEFLITNGTAGNITVNGAAGGTADQLFILVFTNNDVVDRTIDFAVGGYADVNNEPLDSIVLQAGNRTRLTFVGGATGVTSTLVGGGSSANIVTEDLTSTANRVHTFDNNLSFTGTGTKLMSNNDGGGQITNISAGDTGAILAASDGTNISNLTVNRGGGLVFSASTGAYTISVTPPVDSDSTAQVMLRRTADGLMQVADMASLQVLSGAADPVDGTTVAWFANQIYINTTDGGIFYAATKSSDPDTSGAGSTFTKLPTAEITTNYIDSSAAVVTETLPATTGLGVVRLYTNEAITNTATLAVQPGETLNGVTDGTFLFSNYSVGTQFRVDEVSGGWVVSVVGAAVNTNLSPVAYVEGAIIDHNPTDDDEDFEEFDLQTLVAVNETGWNVDPVNNVLPTGWSIDGTGAILAPAGTWTIEYYLDHPAETPTASVGVQENIANASARIMMGEFVNNTGAVSQSFRAGWALDYPIRRQMGIRETVTFIEPTQIHFGTRTALNGLANENYALRISIYDATPTEVVLAGMVEPTTLANARFSLSTDSAAAAVCPFDTTDYNEDTTKFVLEANGGVTVQPGKYLVTVKPSRQGALLDWEVWNATANSQVMQGRLDHAGTIDNTDHATTYLNITTASEIQLRELDGDFNAVWNGSTDLYGCTIEFVELPTSTVVNPDALTPTDLNLIQVSLTTTVNDAAQTNYGFDETVFSMGSELSLSATGSIQGLQPGKTYELRWQGSGDGLGTGNSVYRFVDLTANAGIGEVWEVLSAGLNVPESNQSASSVFFTPTVVTEVGVDYVGGTVGEMSSNSLFTVKELPTSTVIQLDPTNLEVNTLVYDEVFMTANQNTNANTTGDITELTYTVTQAGKYEIAYTFQHIMSNLAGSAVDFWIADGSNNELGGRTRFQYNAGDGGAFGDQMYGTDIFDLAVGDVVKVRYQNSSTTAAGTIGATLNQSKLIIKQLPSEEYVLAGSVPVETLNSASFTNSNPTASTVSDSGKDLFPIDTTVFDSQPGYFSLASNKFTLRANKRVEVSVTIRTGGGENLQLWDFTNGVTLTPNGSQGFEVGNNGGHFSAILQPSTDIEVGVTTVTSAAAALAGNGIYITVEEKPTSTVLQLAATDEDRTISTTEVNTLRTWIDAKPIYRIAVDLTGQANNAILLGGVDTLVDAYGSGETTGTNVSTLVGSYFNPDAPDDGWNIQKNSAGNIVLRVALNGTASSMVNGTLVLEYTKV